MSEAKGRIAYIVDDEGFVIETKVVFSEEEFFEGNLIAVSLPPNVSFYKRKWNGSEWIEGATQDEIDEITKVEPSPPTDTEQTIELLKKQNQALSKMNTELSNTNAELKQSIILHDGIISELVLKMFDQDTEVM